MFSSYQLPLHFDPKKLEQDLKKLPEEFWSPHFVKIHYDRGWSGIALRSSDGNPNSLSAAKKYIDTPVLDHCPYFKQVLNTFKCPLHRVRLLKLEAGTYIKEHIDPGSGFGQSQLRIHIPIITSKKIKFYSNRKRVVMQPGETWFIDTSYSHSVFNQSNIDRIHLVVDCTVNEWIRSLFPSNFSTQPGWKSMIYYKIRVAKFIGLDCWHAIRSGDIEEFKKRKNILINELRH